MTAIESASSASKLENSKAVNIGMGERFASVCGGAALALFAISRRSLFGWLAGIVGGMLIRRGMSGHCALYDKMGSHSTNA